MAEAYKTRWIQVQKSPRRESVCLKVNGCNGRLGDKQKEVGGQRARAENHVIAKLFFYHKSAGKRGESRLSQCEVWINKRPFSGNKKPGQLASPGHS